MTTAEEIGRDFVEALEEVNWPIDEPFYKTECPFKRPSDEECIHIAVANVEDILYPKSRVQQAFEDWEDYMKSRKGLQMLIATYPPNISVECAVGASWLNWCNPY